MPRTAWDDGVYSKAQNRAFEEVVFFVHFYEGNRRLLKRHIDLVNTLGFDAYAFNLRDDFSVWRPPFSTTGKFGYKHAYADQIEKLLNDVPGKKIVFSFSNPTAAAIEAMSRRNCEDTVALIADSGPSAKFVKSVFNLMVREKDFAPWPVRAAVTPLFSAVWSPRLHFDLHEDLKTFPAHFPILSIRGWKDPLISPDQIDAVFEPHKNLDWRKLALPEAGHLNGLRDFREDYEPVVKRFLSEVATPLNAPP